ncbi:MAG TPA: methyltransferase domain-containing protein [Candidatus Brocadiia bacterium]|nr:class I SAM-dependent methyltransferase [Candidatus Brocadiales bacterium]
MEQLIADIKQKIYIKGAGSDIIEMLSSQKNPLMIPEKGNFLDVGCGKGDFLRYAAARLPGYTCHGTELDKNLIEYILGSDDAYYKKLKISKGDLLQCNFDSNSFDIITVLSVLEHLPNPERVLEELRRILRPGGLLFISVPNYQSFIKNIYGTSWPYFRYPFHLYHYSISNLSLLLKDLRFETIKAESYYFSSFHMSYLITKLLKKYLPFGLFRKEKLLELVGYRMEYYASTFFSWGKFGEQVRIYCRKPC